MKITVIAVGKIKEKFFQDAIGEYSKRLSRYCKLEIIQVADEKTPDSAGEALETQIKEKEGERILSNIRDGSFVVALAIEGTMLNSEELASKIEKWGISGRRIQRLCTEGRIPGATKIGSYWAVPADAEKPKDERIKSGKYIKEKQ